MFGRAEAQRISALTQFPEKACRLNRPMQHQLIG
jgi:hypothetical protein